MTQTIKPGFSRRRCVLCGCSSSSGEALPRRRTPAHRWTARQSADASSSTDSGSQEPDASAPRASTRRGRRQRLAANPVRRLLRRRRRRSADEADRDVDERDGQSRGPGLRMREPVEPVVEAGRGHAHRGRRAAGPLGEQERRRDLGAARYGRRLLDHHQPDVGASSTTPTIRRRSGSRASTTPAASTRRPTTERRSSRRGMVTHNDSVSVDFTDPQRQTLLAGTHEQSGHLFLSTNGGAMWTDIGPKLPAGTGFSSQALVIDAKTYLLGAYTYSNSGRGLGVFRTIDGGQTLEAGVLDGGAGASARDVRRRDLLVGRRQRRNDQEHRQGPDVAADGRLGRPGHGLSRGASGRKNRGPRPAGHHGLVGLRHELARGDHGAPVLAHGRRVLARTRRPSSSGTSTAPARTIRAIPSRGRHRAVRFDYKTQ